MGKTEPSGSSPSSSTADDDGAYVIVPGAPKLAPFNPSSKEVIENAQTLLALRSGDVFYDLGCGDGRVLVSLIRGSSSSSSSSKGCTKTIKGVGVEYDEKFYERARARVRDAGLSEQITVRHGDACAESCADATAIFCYLSNRENASLQSHLRAAHARGARIVSNMFKLSFLGEPSKAVVCDGITKLYLYQKDLGEDSDDEEDDEEDDAEKTPLENAIAAFLDPSNNKALLKVFNLSIVLLIFTLILLACIVEDGALKFHFSVMGVLACCLFGLIQWWMSLEDASSSSKCKAD